MVAKVATLLQVVVGHVGEQRDLLQQACVQCPLRSGCGREPNRCGRAPPRVPRTGTRLRRTVAVDRLGLDVEAEANLVALHVGVQELVVQEVGGLRLEEDPDVLEHLVALFGGLDERQAEVGSLLWLALRVQFLRDPEAGSIRQPGRSDDAVDGGRGILGDGKHV